MDPMTSNTAPPQEPYVAHGSTISAAALAARVRTLEGDLETAEGSIRRLMEQVSECQKTNTALIDRIVWLEHRRRRTLRHAGRYRTKAQQENHYGEKWRRLWLRAEGKVDTARACIVALEAALRALVAAVDDAMTTNADAVGAAVQQARALLEGED